MREVRSAYNILDGIPDGKRPFRRPRCRWQDNIRMDLREVWWEGMEWTHLAQNRKKQWALVNTVMNRQVP
jgi:hypothetical protein